jgi:pyruvate formate lyase activating enzyme
MVTAKHVATKYHKATYYETNKENWRDIENRTVICRLCPNNCVISDGKRGLCRARINIAGKLYSLVYGYPCSLHIDPIEKKPLYHYYSGQAILSFGTFGCNLFCKGCQNFDITRQDASDEKSSKLKYYSPKEIVEIALKNNIKMIAYTYNEPTIFFEYMIDIAKLAKQHGIKNVIVSNGYINPKPLKELCKYIDAANIDIKGITEKFYKEYSKTKLQPILETIKTMHKSGVWIELTNLIIPDMNDDQKNIQKLCTWIKENVGTNVPLHFSKFYPYYKATSIRPTLAKTLENAKDIALKVGLKYVYIGNLGFLENTYCHKCGKLLIEREHGIVKAMPMTGKKKNHCPNCDALLPGIFG